MMVISPFLRSQQSCTDVNTDREVLWAYRHQEQLQF